MKGKNLQPRIFYSANLSFRFDGEIKSFTEKQELREFSTTNRLTMTNKGSYLDGKEKAQEAKVMNGKAHW